MAANKTGARGLGRGLDALIPTTEVKEENPAIDDIGGEGKRSVVKITKIEPNRDQPRKAFDEDKLLELADSIRQFGLLQPLLVQDRKTYYEIVTGERRWRASKLVGLKEIPVIIKNFTEQEIVEISLIENIQREDLNPIEEALAYKKLLVEFNLKQDEVAERVSKSRTAVTNAMRLLKLSDDVQKMVINEMITTGHARALLAIEDPEQQYILAQKIFDEKMSVREVEKLVKNYGKPAKKKEKKNIDESMEVIYRDMEEKFKKSMNTKVAVSSKGDGTGKIEIEFYSHEEFDRIAEILMKKN